ncbi:MAG: hypothetical protein QM754_10330 [Tepidisphaeraceae bacterium]
MNKQDWFTADRLIRQTLADNPKSGGTLNNLSQLELMRGHYQASFDAGMKATEYLNVPRVDLRAAIKFAWHEAQRPGRIGKGAAVLAENRAEESVRDTNAAGCS